MKEDSIGTHFTLQSFLRWSIRIICVVFLLYSMPNSFGITPYDEDDLNLMADDTAKVRILLSLGKEYCSKDNEKALVFLQEAFGISTTKHFSLGIGKSLLWQGRVYYYKDDYDIANTYYDKAKDILLNSDNYDALTFLFFFKGENSKIQGDFLNALEFYKQAVEYSETSENIKIRSACYNCMGHILLTRNEPQKALIYFRIALKEKESIQDKGGESDVLRNMGITFGNMKEYDSALIYHRKAIEINRELKTERGIASSEYHIGRLLVTLGRYNEAEESLLNALALFINLDEKTGIIIVNLQLALARNFQDKPDAIEIAETALSIALNIDNPILTSLVYKTLSEIYSYQEKFKESYSYLLLHRTLQDSLFNTEKERMLIEFEEKYRSEQKDNQIALLKQEGFIQRQNIILLMVSSFTLLAIIILLIILFRNKSIAYKRNMKLKEQEQIIHDQENKLIENEKLKLENQLESKNRELASKALEMIRFNDTISSIIEKLDGLNDKFDQNQEVSRHIKEIVHQLENQTKQNIWNEFDEIFKNIHTGFYYRLLEICPDLTATEIKTAALLKLNLTTKEIAAIAFKSEGGVKTTRYRLRKKLGLTSDEKLVPFLLQI